MSETVSNWNWRLFHELDGLAAAFNLLSQETRRSGTELQTRITPKLLISRSPVTSVLELNVIVETGSDCPQRAAF
jgi:hypothetical protein